MQMDTQTGLQLGINLINVILLAGGIAGIVLVVKLLLKLNRALDIYLEKNRKDSES